jgi:hypothetical protein
MRCRLAVAAMVAALLVMPALAQHAGSGHVGGSGGHAGGGFVSHGSMSTVHTSAGFHTGGYGRPGFVGSAGYGYGRPGYGYAHPGSPRGPLGPGRYPYRPGFYPGRGWGWYGYPWVWGGYAYPWWYGDTNWYDTSSYYSQPYYPQYDYSDQNYANYPPAYQQNLEAEVNRLNDQVASLREQQEEMQSSHQTASSNPTELVFRDKHTEEIENYAIVGQTLWVLTADRARRIPLSDLNLSATRKANEDRSSEFNLPR